MQLNELKEQYREQLEYGNCQYGVEDMENFGDIIINSDSYIMEDFDYLDEVAGKNVVTDNNEIMDYIAEENVEEYKEEDAHDDIVEKFAEYENANNCDEGSSNEKEKRSNESPGFFGIVRKFFQPLFAPFVP